MKHREILENAGQSECSLHFDRQWAASAPVIEQDCGDIQRSATSYTITVINDFVIYVDRTSSDTAVQRDGCSLS